MDMPVIAAARLERHVMDADLRRRERREITPAAEILRVGIVRRADGEDHLPRMPRHRLVSIARLLPPHFLCHAERRPCLRPARIERDVRQYLRDLRPRDAVPLCTLEMIAEGRIREPLRYERDHRHKAAVTQRKLLLAAPHLAE